MMWKWSDLKRLLKAKPALRDTADLGAVMWPVLYLGPNAPVDAHITVVIFTDINNPDLGFNVDDVISVVKEFPEAMLRVKAEGIEWFGAEKNVPVLRVSHSYLELFHDMLEQDLTARGIPTDQTFPEYKPHVTVTPEAALDESYPDFLMAGPVEVWWGNVHHRVFPR